MAGTGGHLLVWWWGAFQQRPGHNLKERSFTLFWSLLEFALGGRGKEEIHCRFQVMELHYVGSAKVARMGEGFNWTRKQPSLPGIWNASMSNICINPSARAFHGCFWMSTNRNHARGNPETFRNSTQSVQKSHPLSFSLLDTLPGYRGYTGDTRGCGGRLDLGSLFNRL